MTYCTDVTRFSVSRLIEDQVARTPDNIAVLDNAEEVSYRELNNRSNRLAHLLRKQGIDEEKNVGVLLDRSISAVVAILGILKAGGVYVPLDSRLPHERLNELVEDADLTVIVTDKEHSSGTHISGEVGLVDIGASVLATQPSANIRLSTSPQSAAYVLYTSGSTGKPKGVVGIHRSISNNLTWMSFEPDDVFCLTASLAFGASITPLFLPLIAGRPLVIIGEKDVRDTHRFLIALDQNNVTRVVLVPAVLRQLLELGTKAAARLTKLRNVGVSGTALTTDLIRDFWKLVPNATLHNGYSSTEIGALSTLWEVTHESLSRKTIAIGRPVPGTTIHVLDEERKPVNKGDCGELYVGAAHLARGYVKDPKLTSERFIADPFSLEPGARLYRTGDIGRVADDGELELVGRVDNQVKIRGFRIALEEVDTALASHPSVREAASAVGFLGGEERLVGYVVAHPGISLSVDQLRDSITTKLPDYMIPSAFVFLDELPLSPNGKVDRHALPAVGPQRPALEVEYVGPNSHLEIFLANICSELLGREKIGMDDHFLDLGGDSLFAIRFISRIEQELHLVSPIEVLFEYPTVREFASYIAPMVLDPSLATRASGDLRR